MQLPNEDEDRMRLPGFSLGQDLATYLSQLRKVVFSPKATHGEPQVTVVLGNPSCDLDSFICAFVLSYFYNAKPDLTKHHRHPIYVPVLNLPYVEARDLWRMRPEFGVAIRGAFDGLTPQKALKESDEETESFRRRDRQLLEQLFTIHELANNEQTMPSLRRAFQRSDHIDTTKASPDKVDLILVDHNAPSIETINESDIRERFQVVGCIDHHVEENYVPKNANPRIVRLGIGSCMSLITEHLRALNLWTATNDKGQISGYRQISRLALTPILIDTWDLKAPGDKCSDLDREEVSFLAPQTGGDFDREDLFQQAQTAKAESLNLLRMQEIFARDYKSYVEEPKEGDHLNVGIVSVVQDLEWLANHAKGKDKLVKEVKKYAREGEKFLDVFSMLTRSGDRKQLCIFSFNDKCNSALDIFESSAGELQLQDWDDDKELAKTLDDSIGKQSWKVWWVGDTSKSRKQVAPLLRDAVQQSANGHQVPGACSDN